MTGVSARGFGAGGSRVGVRHPPRREHFAIFVPTGRAINPITKANWEGVGVEPDVKVPAGEARETARAMALKAIGR